MAKINFDETSLKNHINGNIESSILALKNAKYIASILSVPYEFDYSSYLKNLDDNINSDLNEINEIYNKIKRHSKKFSNINNELKNDIIEIENYSISLRQSAIK